MPACSLQLLCYVADLAGRCLLPGDSQQQVGSLGGWRRAGSSWMLCRQPGQASQASQLHPPPTAQIPAPSLLLAVQAQLLRVIHRGLEGEVPRLQPLHLASALWAYAVVGIPADWTDALLQQASSPAGSGALLE